MPQLRYGPDITDDADNLLRQQQRLVKQRKKLGKLNRTDTGRLKDIDAAIKAGFGNRANLREYARESVRRKGYSDTRKSKKIGGVRFKGRDLIGGSRARAAELEAKRLLKTGRTREEIARMTNAELLKAGRSKAKPKAGSKAAAAAKKRQVDAKNLRRRKAYAARKSAAK